MQGCENGDAFEITGFRLSGHTHHATSKTATQGIQVNLLSADNHVLKSVVTDANGDYVFENVVSGDYSIQAVHPSWVLAEPSTQMISVTNRSPSHFQVRFGSVEVSTDFVVTGFKITGSVENQSGSHAVEGVEMQLLAEEGSGRSLPLSPPAPSPCPEGCVVSVDASGKFAFTNVQSGVYKLVGVVARCHPRCLV